MIFHHLLVALCWTIAHGQAFQNCMGKQATYKLYLIATWSPKTHRGGDLNQDHCFSALIGASHNNNYTMWAPGSLASSGLQIFAQKANKRNTLHEEIEEQISKKNAAQVIWEVGFEHLLPFNMTLTLKNPLSVSGKFPLVSVISMISPSPDWFVGVHDVNLCGGQSFESRVSLALFVYDGGMDNGTLFDSPNSPTNPPVEMFKITKDMDTPFKSNTTIPPLGYIVFIKISETETATLSTAGSPTLRLTSLAGNNTTPKPKEANGFAMVGIFTCILSLVFIIIFQ